MKLTLGRYQLNFGVQRHDPVAGQGAAVVTPTAADHGRWLAHEPVPPQRLRWILEAAVGGALQEQYELFTLMEDTWPRLAKALSEVRRAAARTTYTVSPWLEHGQNRPSPGAQERADLVSAALRRWEPHIGSLEYGFEECLFHALDAYGKGVSVQEVLWQRTTAGILPRAAHFLTPRRYGWDPQGTRLGLVDGRSDRSAGWREFPPDQFLVGIWHARSGLPGATALLRALAPYWVGVTYGWQWLLNTAQIFGVPFRWATYDASQPHLAARVAEMLENLGSAGWAAFPAGTVLEFKEAAQSARDNPQVVLQDLADRACDLLVLGQTLTTDAGDRGTQALGTVHAGVRSEVIAAAAQWCADLLNYQLVPAILRLNWGDTDEIPTVVPDLSTPGDPEAMARRDEILVRMGLPLGETYLHERHGVPPPAEGEAVVAPPAPAMPGWSPPADGTPNPQKRAQTGADGWGATSTLAGRHTGPQGPARARAGHAARQYEYETPDHTRVRLARALEKDLEPVRAALGPLLEALEAEGLSGGALTDALEAAIARLEELELQMPGAGALAGELEAALAQAAIAGAARAVEQADRSDGS